MGFLDIDTSAAVEPSVVPADQEYELRITSFEMKDDKNGNKYLFPRFEVVSEPTARDFSHFLGLPHSGMSEKQMNNCLWNLKCFETAFGVSLSELSDPEEMVGETCWAILGVKNDPQYGDQNYVKKFIPKQ